MHLCCWCRSKSTVLYFGLCHFLKVELPFLILFQGSEPITADKWTAKAKEDWKAFKTAVTADLRFINEKLYEIKDVESIVDFQDIKDGYWVHVGKPTITMSNVASRFKWPFQFLDRK